MLLAAVELRLPHPAGATAVTLTARLDEAFGRFLQRLGWQQAVPAQWLPGGCGLPVAI
jgi:tRNA pseudouridine65 synthase